MRGYKVAPRSLDMQEAWSRDGRLIQGSSHQRCSICSHLRRLPLRQISNLGNVFARQTRHIFPHTHGEEKPAEQIQCKYKANTRQIQCKYKATTMQLGRRQLSWLSGDLRQFPAKMGASGIEGGAKYLEIWLTHLSIVPATILPQLYKLQSCLNYTLKIFLKSNRTQLTVFNCMLVHWAYVWTH